MTAELDEAGSALGPGGKAGVAWLLFFAPPILRNTRSAAIATTPST